MTHTELVAVLQLAGGMLTAFITYAWMKRAARMSLPMPYLSNTAPFDEEVSIDLSIPAHWKAYCEFEARREVATWESGEAYASLPPESLWIFGGEIVQKPAYLEKPDEQSLLMPVDIHRW